MLLCSVCENFFNSFSASNGSVKTRNLISSIYFRMLIKLKNKSILLRFGNLKRFSGTMSNIEQLLLPDGGGHIGYKQRLNNSTKPGIIFCSGFLSSLYGTKACYLDNYCMKNNLSYLRFDYVGHEYSSGSMDDFSISLWKKNTLQVLDQLTQGPQIIVGSSIGGWLALLVAMERGDRIHSVVTIANAADMFYKRLSGESCEVKAEAERSGYFKFESEYDIGARISFSLLEDSRKNQILNLKQIPVLCPVRLLHGMNDETIPYQTSLEVAKKLKSVDVELSLVKDSDHRFSSAADLHRIGKTLDDLLDLNTF